MEHARKLLLLPSDKEHQFFEEHLSNLDKQIQDILKKNMNDNEKAKLYVQALQKYVIFQSVNSGTPPNEQKR